MAAGRPDISPLTHSQRRQPVMVDPEGLEQLARLAEADPAPRSIQDDAGPRIWRSVQARLGVVDPRPARRCALSAVTPVAVVLVLIVVGWSLRGVASIPPSMAPATAGAVVGSPMTPPPDIASSAAPASSQPGFRASPSVSEVGLASCVRMYDLTQLALRSWAFDGTLVSVSGSSATFRVNEWFRGGPQGEVALTIIPGTGTVVTSEGGPPLGIGSRYLVSGEQSYLWGCGFTRPYDNATASKWRTAFGGR